jgi:hypothetical protein
MSWHWLLFWVSSCACNTLGSSIFCSAANFTGAFSSQVESLGGSENATKEFYWSIFKPSGITWRLGKCDQTKV